MRAGIGSTLLAAAAALALLLSGCASIPGTAAVAEASPPAEASPLEIPVPAPPLPTDDDAVAAYYRGDLKAAAAAYRGILARESGNLAARGNLVQVLREAGRPLEALEELDVLLQTAADDPRAGDPSLHLRAAETALFAGQPERALRYLEDSMRPGEAAAGALYLAGLALADLGRDSEAADALAGSLQEEGYNPQGWFRLGTLHLALGLPEEAERELLEALSQERNLTQAFLPLARIYLADGRVEKAYGLLRRAEGALPGNLEVSSLLGGLVAAHPELTAAVREERRLSREALVPRRAESVSPERDSLPVVRIGLAEAVKELYLKAGGAYLFEGSVLARPAGGVLLARLAEDGLSVELLGDDGALIARSAGILRLSYEDPADTTILFDVRFGQGSFWAGSEDRMYRGAVELTPHPDGLTVVNELPIEEYLYSVLPSEMPSSWPAAALQAQAVAARSYTLANLGRFASRGFDLLGTVASAAYRGMGSENAAVRAAVDATRGLVLLEPAGTGTPGGGDRPLSAFYSANCGGYTETTEYVWGFPSSFPAVADLLLPGDSWPLPPAELARWLSERPVSFSSHPQYANRSAYRWKLWVPREEIEARLGKGDDLGSVLAISALRRGSSGRIPEVRVRGTAGETTVKWDAIRWRLGGLRSNLFVVEAKLGPDGLPQYFVFTGAGWGHGVGMCQTGAAGMASVGFSAEAILRHYYGDPELRVLY
jgi:stage II sporulation protein D